VSSSQLEASLNEKPCVISSKAEDPGTNAAWKTEG
jgi:hypothetical protein